MYELKPFQRVKLAHGGIYIVLPREATEQAETSNIYNFDPVYLARKDGFTTEPWSQDGAWRVVAVYDKPDSAGFSLNPEKYGKLLWSEEHEDIKKKMAVLKANITGLQAEYKKLEEALDE